MFHFSIDLLFLPPAEERILSCSPPTQSASSSRRSSVSSSHGSQSIQKKPNTPKKEDKPGPSKSKETKKRLHVTNYSPKRQFEPTFKFVLNESRFFDELQSRCAELCTVAKYPGRSDALKATAKKLEVGLTPITA